MTQCGGPHHVTGPVDVIVTMVSDDTALRTMRTDRGRPRNEKAREAILDVAMESLLAHGVAAMNMDAVAAGAGVSMAAIYRWWPSKETLAMDALDRKWESVPAAPDTGSLRDGLRNLLWPWTELIARRPYGRVIAGLLGQVLTDPDFALTYRARFLDQRRDHGRMILQQAIARGEIPARTRVETVLDMLYGPVYPRLMHGHAPLDHTFIDGVVDIVLDNELNRNTLADNTFDRTGVRYHGRHHTFVSGATRERLNGKLLCAPPLRFPFQRKRPHRTRQEKSVGNERRLRTSGEQFSAGLRCIRRDR